MALQLRRNTRESCSGGLKRVADALQRRGGWFARGLGDYVPEGLLVQGGCDPP